MRCIPEYLYSGNGRTLASPAQTQRTMPTTINSATIVSGNTDPNPGATPPYASDGTYRWQVVGLRSTATTSAVITVMVNGAKVTSVAPSGNTMRAACVGASQNSYIALNVSFTGKQDTGDWTLNLGSNGGGAVVQSFIKGGGGGPGKKKAAAPKAAVVVRRSKPAAKRAVKKTAVKKAAVKKKASKKAAPKKRTAPIKKAVKKAAPKRKATRAKR